MLSILRRNAEWISSHRESLGKKPRLREEFSERAEIKVLDALRVLGGEEWDVYHRVRVPMLDTIRGKGEIDLIAVGSKCVLAVEVKNWVGSVEEADGEFLQRGESRGRVLETHNDKVKSLERMYRILIGTPSAQRTGYKCETTACIQLVNSTSPRFTKLIYYIRFMLYIHTGQTLNRES